MEYAGIQYIFIISFILLLASSIYNLKQKKLINELSISNSRDMQSIFFDSITNLPNRNNIEIIITEHIKTTSRRDRSFYMFAIKALDLKNLDRRSNIEANELSQDIADGILSSIRDEDNVARVSHDEYIIVFNEYLKPQNLQIPIERIKHALKDVNISFASSTYPKDGDSTETLIDSILDKL